MELRSAEIHRLHIPYTDRFRNWIEAQQGQDPNEEAMGMTSMLLTLTTADGARGIGTIDAIPGYSLQSHDEIRQSLSERLLPPLLDSTPLHPNKLAAFFDSIDGAVNAKSGLELAYLDLYCRERGQSIADFYGGRLHETEKLNGWVGVDTPEHMAERAQAYLDRGFTSLKMKMDGDADKDLARYRAIKEAVGEEMAIRTDVNTGYGDRIDEAINLARALEDDPVVHFEQPIPLKDLDGLRAITQASSTTVMADECILTPSDAYHVLAEGIADRVKLKILRLGGTMPVNKVLHMVETADIQAAVGHGFCLSPAASAELQVISTHEGVLRPAESVGPLKMADEPFEPRLTSDNGEIRLPDGPGLGVELIDDKLDKFSTGSWVVE